MQQLPNSNNIVIRSADEYAAAFSQILSPHNSNDERRVLESQVAASLTTPENLRQLVFLLCNTNNSTTNSGVRHLAAVLLRKKIFTLWKSLSREDQLNLRSLLLNNLFSEEVKPIRFSIAHVIVRLAKAEALNDDGDDGGGTNNNNNKWPELHEAIRTASAHASPAIRELAMVLVYSFAEILSPDPLSEANQQHQQQHNEHRELLSAAESVVRCLEDSEPGVLSAALKAAGMLVTAMSLLPSSSSSPSSSGKKKKKAGGAPVSGNTLKDSFMSSIVQHASRILASCIHTGVNTGEVSKVGTAAVELFDELIDELSVRQYGSLLLQIAQSLMQAVATAPTPSASAPGNNGNGKVRQAAATSLAHFITAKPKFVVSSQLLDPIVQLCLHLFTEDDTIALDSISQDGGAGGDDDDDDDIDGCEDVEDMVDVSSPCTNGGVLLSTLGSSIPQKTFTAAVLPYINQFTSASGSNSNSSSPRAKKALMVLLSCVSETNPSFLRRRMGQILDITQRFVTEDPAVNGNSLLPREAAAFALTFFCNNLHPEIMTHHASLLPLLLPLLGDSVSNASSGTISENSDVVKRRAAAALDKVCENMEKDLDPYVPQLLPAVVQAMQSSRTSLDTQCALCSVITSIAAAQCASFLPFAPAVLELLQLPLSSTTGQNNGNTGSGDNGSRDSRSNAVMALRAQATETVGVVGAAMGREAFRPYLPFFMGTVVVENLQMKNAPLKEQSFGLLANVCEILKEEFLPYLDDSLRFALQSIEEDKTVYYNKHLLAQGEGGSGSGSGGFQITDDSALSNVAGGGDDNHLGNDDDDDGGDNADMHLLVRSADIDEKCSAIYTIGVFAKVLVSCFTLERVALCWEPLGLMQCHYYETVRANALVARAHLLTAAHGVPPEQVDKHAACDTVAPETRAQIEDFVHEGFLHCVESEEEPSVVVAACEALGVLLGYYGAQALVSGPDEVVRALLSLLRRRTPCQSRDRAGDCTDDDDDNDNDSDEGYDDGGDTGDPLFDDVDARNPGGDVSLWRQLLPPEAVLRGMRVAEQTDDACEAAMLLLESLAEAYGAGLAPFMPFFVLLLASYGDVTGQTTRGKERIADDVTNGTGTLATVLRSVGPAAAAPYVEHAATLALSVIAAGSDTAWRANGCFLLNVLLSLCPAFFNTTPAALTATLEALWSVLSNGGSGASDDGDDGEAPEAIDNAASAACTLVRCLDPSVVPFDAVLPTLLPALPMRVDKAENANCVQTLVYVFARCAAAEGGGPGWLPALVAAAARMLASPAVEEGEKLSLAQQGIAPFVQRRGPEAWAAAVAAAALKKEESDALAQCLSA